MQTLHTIVSRLTGYTLLFIFIVTNIVFFSYLGFMRHDNFHSRRLDLGNMEQAVWNLANGNGFTLTDPMGTENISRLGIHADVLLAFLVPFYFLWSDPKMFVLIQAIVVSLGAIPVYWIAKDTLKSHALSLLFSLAYLLYPPLQHVLLHDFHAVALSTTFLLFAYWYMRKKRYVLCILLAILAGLGKEHIWIIVGLMGGYIALVHRRLLLGTVMAVFGFGMSYLLFWYVIPSFAVSGKHFALGYLSDYGGSENGVVMGLIASPWKVLQTMVLPDRLEYYYRLLLPLGFLPLVSPGTLVFALPGLFINVLSSNGLMRQIDYQYVSDLIPFLLTSAISGLDVLRRKVRSLGAVVVGVLVVSMGIASYLWGEIPLTREDRFFFFTWAFPETEIMRHVATSIDSSYTVSATNNIGAHFSARQFLYNFPVNAETADFSVVLLGDQYAWPSGDAQRQALERLLASRNHEVIAQQGNFYAFRRKQ